MTLLNIQIGFAHALYLDVTCLSFSTLHNVKYGLQITVMLGTQHTQQGNTNVVMTALNVS